MSEETEYYASLITQLAEGLFEVSKWEADFLASLLDHPGRLSDRQKAVLDDMGDKYGVTP